MIDAWRTNRFKCCPDGSVESADGSGIGRQNHEVEAGECCCAADKGYDNMSFREALRAVGVRPLIKHRVFAPYAHNARIDDERYHQRSTIESVNSSLKHSYGSTVRAHDWFRQFREIAPIAGVHNIERAIDA